MLESWEFNKEVTDIFDDMLQRSIPQLDVMRNAVVELAVRYHKPLTNIIDLGTSRGEALAPLVDKLGARAKFIGLEISEPMYSAARERFAGLSSIVSIRRHDLRTGLPPESATVILSILTLQFIPINYRQDLIEQIYDRLLPNGVFILVEKVLGSSAQINRDMVDIYHSLKFKNGYSQEEIDRKALMLEGVLVPVTADWNVELLRSAGFTTDCFWRWMNFAGWVAHKK